MKSLASVVLTGLALVTSSCTARSTFPITSQRCYRLEYDNSDASSSFAEFVLLEPGTDSGEVRSGRARGDTSRFWRMFLVDGQWKRDGEHLILDFSNGFSGVTYRLDAQGAQSLEGEMRFLYDVVDQRPPPAPVHARSIRCQDANIESPVKVAA